MRYPALIDGEAGAYGVVFPDIPGVGAMGCTIDEALVHAEEALRDYAIESARDGVVLIAPSALEEVEVPAGSALTSVLLIPPFEEKGGRGTMKSPWRINGSFLGLFFILLLASDVLLF